MSTETLTLTDAEVRATELIEAGRKDEAVIKQLCTEFGLDETTAKLEHEMAAGAVKQRVAADEDEARYYASSNLHVEPYKEIAAFIAAQYHRIDEWRAWQILWEAVGAERRAKDTDSLAETLDDQQHANVEADFLELDDLDDANDDPEWVIDAIAEVETIGIWTADTGAGKSILGADVTVAALTGREWLGHAVHAKRILYIDEENPRRTVKRRLRALGLRGEHRPGLRYANRQGIELGTPEWNAWLRKQIEEFRPDLIIIDTAMSSTSTEVNENDSIVTLYKALRPMVSDSGCCAIIMHHNRKDGPGGRKGDPSQAALGGRQWVGQADQQLTIRVKGELEIDRADDGSKALRRELILEGGKDREGLDSRPELIVISSHKSAGGALLDMEVANEGIVERELSITDQLAEEIVEVVTVHHAETDTPMDTAKIAEALDQDPKHGTFTTALKSTTTGKRPRLLKPKRGKYEPRVPRNPDDLDF